MSTLSISAGRPRRAARYNPCVPPEDAVARYSALLGRNAGTCLTRLQRAKAYVQLGDYASACKDFDEWIQQNTQSTKESSLNGEAAAAMTDALFYRGVCLARLAQVEAALEDFREVLHCEPARSRAMYELAACEARLGDFSNAVTHYEAALQLDEVGKEKELLLRYRLRRECKQQQVEQQQRQRRERRLQRRKPAKELPMPSSITSMGSSRLSDFRAMPNPPIPLSANTFTTGNFAVSAAATDEMSPRSPISFCGAVNASSSSQLSVDAVSDSVAEAVSLSEYTTPAVEQESKRAAFRPPPPLFHSSASRHVPISQRHALESDDFTGVSSSTESSPGRSSVETSAGVEEGSNGGGGMRPRWTDVENDMDGVSAVDPACALSSCSEVYDDDFAEVEVREGAQNLDASANANMSPGRAANPPPLLTAAYYYQRGLQHRRRGELKAAIDMYTKVLVLSPAHFKSLFNRAFCYDKLNDYDPAIRDYSNAVKLDPENAFTYYNLGISYDHKGRHSRAVQAFTHAIELDNTRPDFYHNRGFSQRKQLRFEAAIDDYTAAIALDSSHFKSYYNRAYCYCTLGRYVEAAADYSAALRIDNRNANAYHNRGVALEKLGKLNEALEDFTRALQRDPTLTFSLNARGLVYDQLQQYDKALEDFTRAIELDKRNPSWLHNRGYTYRNMGQLELAIADYTASIKLAPHSCTAYNNRAFAYRKLGRYEEAIEDYTVVLREEPTAVAKALNNRAYCFARLGLFEDAIRDYTEVLATDAVNAHALYNRGISYEKCANYNAAIDDFTRAIQIAPEATVSSNAYYSRGTSRLQLNQVPQARADLKLALKLDSLASGLRGRALKVFQTDHPAGRLLQELGVA
ncbi:hypothetical protein ABL78_3903 [Leptomonas seymouri]|uniref:Uncharacterized protein n=1 Tax=Leptomonas seymouri TaxID=5684 RepID=A0A0N1HXB6_LEPSE|nr:hypothetical protein ABL78_3903 [Leptomonas seymouri]|eukprot:KPI87038.1 hypothetical protein ABL78_3903 [Leptomonas seymouri]